MFLSITGERNGVIKGEAQDSKFKDQIEVLAWSWSMVGRMKGGARQSSIREVSFTKLVDRASTALMSALRTNEMIKEATLTIRKTGGAPMVFLTIKMEQGLVASIDIEAGGAAGAATLIERVSMSFNKVTVNYTPQGPDGREQGATTFMDQWMEG
jgi:type VI secretion system secreted protein Hcp